MREMTERETRDRIKGLLVQHDRIKAMSLAYHNRANFVKAIEKFRIATWILRSIKIYALHLEDLESRKKAVKVNFD